jgi:hypothetical protein
MNEQVSDTGSGEPLVFILGACVLHWSITKVRTTV